MALVAGAAVSVIAFLLARYGPSGDSWSFRGNGALAAYTLVPALLAGGWTAVVVRHRGRSDWLRIGAGAGVIGLALAVIDAVLLPLGGASADSALGPFLLVALAAWAIVAPALGWVLFRPAGRAGNAGATAGAVALWLVGLAAGLVAIGYLVPAGS